MACVFEEKFFKAEEKEHYMIVSISGPAGSGKSTVAKALAKKLGFKRYYIGGMRREAARKRGLTIEEYNKLGESDPSTDLEVDRFQEELGKTEDNFVIEGRTSFHFIPQSVKVYLDVDIIEGAKRILGDQEQEARNEQHSATVEEKVQKLKERMASDSLRYKKYFGIDCYNPSNYDLVVNTTHRSPEQVVQEILTFINKRG